MSDELVIGGRAFRPADLSRRTVRHDHYMTAAVAAAGCDRLMPLPGDNDQAFLLRMFGQLLASGQACRVLSAFLLPVGVDELEFSAELADETRRHLEQCNTERDRQVVQVATVEACKGFFLRGLASLSGFPNSTAGSESQAASQSAS